MLFPAVEHYETFAQSFVSLMAHSVDVSMLWGLLFLVVKVSSIPVLLTESNRDDAY